MHTLLQDLRYGARMLWKKPGFTLIAVITLATGIGLNAAIFSAVNSILLRPLPYQEPDRLVQIWESQRDGAKDNVVSPDNLIDWRNQAQSFEGLSAYDAWLPALSQAGETVQVVGAMVSANFFSLLGATPQLGRTFAPEEEKAGRNRVVVISHSFWQSHLGGDANVIGKTLTLNENGYTIIGVLRPDFRHPRLVFDQGAALWRPFDVGAQANHRGSHYLNAIGRLKAGVSLKQAQAEMTAIARQLELAFPQPASASRRGDRI